MKWFTDRTKEISTWAGVAAVAAGALLGVGHPLADPEAWAGFGSVLIGVISIFKKEKKA